MSYYEQFNIFTGVCKRYVSVNIFRKYQDFVFVEGRRTKMTNIEKLLVLLCMSMLIFFSIWDILTLYDAVCWELGAECTVLTVSAITAYLTIAEKI